MFEEHNTSATQQMSELFILLALYVTDLDREELDTLVALSAKELDNLIAYLKKQKYIISTKHSLHLIKKPSKLYITTLFKSIQHEYPDNVLKCLYMYYLQNHKKIYIYSRALIDALGSNMNEESRLIFKILHSMYLKHTPNSNNQNECKEFLSAGISLLQVVSGMPWNFPHRQSMHYKFIDIAKSLGDERSLHTINAMLGTLTIDGVVADEAKVYQILGDTINHIFKLDDIDIIIQNMYAICHYYYAKGDFYKALSFIYFYTVIPRNLIPLAYTPWIYNRTSLAALYLGQIEKSLSIMKNALQLGHLTKNINYIHYCQACIASIYIDQNKLNSAANILQKIIAESPYTSNMSYGILRAKRTFAFCLYKQNKLEESHALYIQTMQEHDEDKILLYEYAGLPFLIELFNAYDIAGYISQGKVSYAKEVLNAANSHIIIQRIIAFRSLALKYALNSSMIAWTHPLVLKYLQKAYDLCEEAKALKEKNKILVLMARRYHALGENIRAKEIVSKIIDINSKYAFQEWHSDLNFYLEKTKKQHDYDAGFHFQNFMMNLFEIKKAQLDLHSQNFMYHKIFAIIMNTFESMQAALYKVEEKKPQCLFIADLENAYTQQFNNMEKKIIHKSQENKTTYYECVNVGFKLHEETIQEKKIHIAFYIPTDLYGEYILFLSFFHTKQLEKYLSNTYFDFISLFIATEINTLFQNNKFWQKEMQEMPDAFTVQKNTFLAPPQSLYHSNIMKDLLKQVDYVASTDAPTLIRGESGVGKELIARRIHEKSNRKGHFIPVNITSISENLFESELFGHEKGSFTGANTQKKGLLELADQGTLFIDEIGDMPYAEQAKLLRVIQEKYFMRVGGTQLIPSNFRLITATHVNLEKAIELGHFRKDLFYRINVIPLNLPPLRERKEDIIPIAEHYIQFYSTKHHKTLRNLTTQDKEAILLYPWQGNIRELRNFCERLILLPSLSVAQLFTLSSNKLKEEKNSTLTNTHAIESTKQETTVFSLPCSDNIESLKAIQDKYIEYVFVEKNGIVGGKNGVAQALGVSLNTAHSWINKLGLRKKYELKLQHVDF